MNRIVSKLPAMFIALFLAFTLWFFVSAPRRERVSERPFAVPISIFGLRRDLVITTSVPNSVNVRLRGRESDLRSLSAQNLEVSLDLGWATQGEARMTLRPQAISVPPDVEVISIDPATITFRVEQLRRRAVPIRPFLVGDPAVGFVIGTPTASPDSALISGPASQVRNVSEVTTERIIMTGRTDTFEQNVAVVSDSSLIRVVDPQVTHVTVPVTAAVGPVAPAVAPDPSGKPTKK
jgi:YbbR domain-containing protein